MHNDESIVSFFLCIDEIVNHMKELGDEIKDTTLVQKILRSLTPKFESKVSAIEEKKDMQTLTVVQLHAILNAFEMRRGGPSKVREDEFKASKKGKEKEEQKELGYISEEDEVKFVKKLQLDTRRFRGKLPFKYFSCGRVGHCATKCPHKGNHEKGKDTTKGNKRWFNNKNLLYS